MCRIALLSFLLLCFTPPIFANIHIQDANHQWLTLKKPAQRIVSLAPNLTEMLYAIGAEKQVVAVSVDSDYPPAVKRLPHIGGYRQINLEALLALHPDLVVAWQGGNSPILVNEIQRLGIPVFWFKTNQLKAVASAMVQLGVLTGHQRRGKAYAQHFLQQLQQLKQHQHHAPRVLIILGQQPLYVATGHGLLAEIVHWCGGVPVFSHLPGLAARITPERLIAAKPDVIIGLSPINLNRWRQWPSVPAVKNRRLFVIKSDWLARAGPRLVLGVKAVCQAVSINKKDTVKY